MREAAGGQGGGRSIGGKARGGSARSSRRELAQGQRGGRRRVLIRARAASPPASRMQ